MGVGEPRGSALGSTEYRLFSTSDVAPPHGCTLPGPLPAQAMLEGWLPTSAWS